MKQEIEFLKAKIDAGANFIFTQMFYDVDIFIDWVKRVRAAGINVPIVPGIMPIQSWQKFMTWVKRESIVVPQKFWDVLLPVQDNDEAVREVGTKLVAQMCRDIVGSGLGIRGLHVYTLNLEKGARMLLEELRLESRREQVHPLPWRPSLTPNRRGEAIRPIFWANRQQSYLSRTEDWDEFPNGRWGDSRSPAYGDLDGYPVKIDVPGNDAHEIWGEPKQFSDITALFAKFCRNELSALPWSSQPPSKETSVIDQQLAKMNELGYLTINSQPAVDGASSEDPTHGWGPAGGYVYQKAYLEFFVAPNLLDELVRRIEKDPRITYYAVNRQGDLRTNTHSEGPNAVTWGVFPGKEIVQPTIVEAVSFIAWKDEAFELGMQWANFYDENSTSRKLIQDVMNTSYLVNIVANDFKDGLSIFEPFQLDRPAASIAANAVNTVSDAVSQASQVVGNAAASAVNGVKDLVNGSSNVEANGKAHPVTNGNGNGVSHPEPAESAVNMGNGTGPAPKASKNLDELFDKTPLFMRENPAAGEENETLEALKSLIFDGTPDEIAENFKEQATERHQAGQLRDALGFYNQGIEAKPENQQLRLSLLLNRAACNLSLGNHGSVLRDTGVVLKETPESAKAYFRAASSLIALSRWEDASDCITRGKQLPSELSAEKQKTWEGLESKVAKGTLTVQERTERERRAKVGQEALRRAIEVSSSPPMREVSILITYFTGTRPCSDPLPISP
jgi:methylenetetrahydrofolate reductase (NADPH)